MRKDRAFSLIELLVAMAIIAALAGLISVTLARAKHKAKGTGCLSNLKQWGIATHLFAAENNGKLPHDGYATPNAQGSFLTGWYIELPEVLGVPSYWSMPWRTNAEIDVGRSIWICPQNPRRSDGQRLFHYCLNSRVNGDEKQINLARLPNPAATVWLFDNGRINAVAQQNNVHTNLHSEGAHILFVDGHARHFKNVEYWDFSKKAGRTNNPDLIWFP